MPAQTEDATLARCVLMDLIPAFARPANFETEARQGCPEGTRNVSKSNQTILDFYR